MVSKKQKNSSSNYTAEDIYVLEGLEPVRKRPGMYIGSTGIDGLHHLIWEVIDNSLDEAMGGHCDLIEVVLTKDGRVKISDNGRGIPVEVHKQTGKSTLETVMTTLHAGGKFGGEAYKVSGGLHGVGVSVVCALSKYMRAEVCRDGGLYMQEYSRGVPKAKVKKIDTCKKTGTTVIFEPDDEIFKDKDVKFSIKRILTHVRHQAYLTPKVKLVVKDETISPAFSYTFYFEGGLKSYLKYLLGDNEPKHENPFYCKAEREGVLVETVLQYAKEMECFEESFANNINTGEGGMHLTGFRTALTRVINDYARKNGYLKEKDENLLGNDMREGLVAVVSVKIREPQFEGQTKAKLGNPEAKTAVEGVFGEAFSDWLEKNPSDARVIVENCLLSARARRAAKAARTTILRKGVLDGLTLPGKLSDCRSKDAAESELYIVEGDSAGGSSRQARDSRYQAILPLRGKILNVEKARLDRLLDSQEIKSLIIALGTAISQDFDVSKIRYHRVVIMTDADSVTGDTPILLFNKEKQQFFLTKVDEFIKNCDDTSSYQILTFNPANKGLELKEILQTIQHPLRTALYQIKTSCGYFIKATDCHSIYIFDGGVITTKKSSEIKAGDLMIFPKNFPSLEKEVVFDLTSQILGSGLENIAVKMPRTLAQYIPADSWCELDVSTWKTLQEQRELAGISRKEMAQQIDVYDKVIQQWEQKIDNVMPHYMNFQNYLSQIGEKEEAFNYNIFVPLRDFRGKLPLSAQFFYENHSRAIKTKFALDKDSAYLLGFYLGDGCAAFEKGSPNRFTLSLGEQKKQYFETLERIITTTLQAKPVLEKRKDCFSLHFHSLEFRFILQELGLLGKKGNEKFIPDIFFNAKKEIKEALLAGLLDSDGFITVWRSKETSKTKAIYGWQMSSDKIIQGISVILRQDGVFANYSQRKQQPHLRKDGVLIKPRFDSFNLSVSTVEFLEQTKNIWQSHKDGQKLTDYLAEVKPDKIIGKRLVAISDNFVGLKVKSVKKIESPQDEWVYDFSVAGHQNFIAGVGGCLLHNTDGAHIRTLLLTLFYRYFKELIEKGYLYIAQPPLYKIQSGKQIQYAYNDADKNEIVSEFKKLKGEKGDIKVKKSKKAEEPSEAESPTESIQDGDLVISGKEEGGGKIAGVNIQRYKGLGEMNPEELWDTTMNPQNRILLQVSIDDAKEADHIFDTLMGSEVAPRKKFIQVHAKQVKNLDI